MLLNVNIVKMDNEYKDYEHYEYKRNIERLIHSFLGAAIMTTIFYFEKEYQNQLQPLQAVLLAIISYAVTTLIMDMTRNDEMILYSWQITMAKIFLGKYKKQNLAEVDDVQIL